MTDEILEGEIVEASTALAVREDATPAPVGLFGTDDPGAIVKKASAIADALVDIIKKQKLSTKIGGKDYVLVEGWTTLGALVGVFPSVEYTRPVKDAEGETVGWEAAVVVRNMLGVTIGRAEAECLRSERNWKGRDDFAVRSMAQTRAMGKALRMPLGWIAVIAGYEATPAEEMPAEAEVPFEPSLPTQDQAGESADAHGTSGTGGEGSAYADEEYVKAFLEFAKTRGATNLKTASEALTAHRKKNDGRVRADWLATIRERLEAVAPAPVEETLPL